MTTKDQFLAEVLQGLNRPRKELPCKYFYDETGSRLFEQICELEEYYLTRTELAIMEQYAPEMARLLGTGCLLIEYGSGSSVKTRLLLDHLPGVVAYIPLDLSEEHLLHSAQQLAASYPQIEVLPLGADFTRDFTLPAARQRETRRVVYFPGSTIGNFGPVEATRLLSRIARVCGSGGALLLGVDLKKDPEIIEPAYNDSKGVTRDFNLNLLSRINRELGADFDLEAFRHHAPYNREEGCIEMHLISLKSQKVALDNTVVSFDEAESILTERSYKYSVEECRELAEKAGLRLEKVWMDELQLFSVQYLTVHSC